ncbi:YD repeat-containing protein, partial [Chitinivorax tropicus]
FDAAGRQTASVDALGYVTEYRYDAIGNRIASTRHATPLSSRLMEEPQARERFLPSDASRFTLLPGEPQQADRVKWINSQIQLTSGPSAQPNWPGARLAGLNLAVTPTKSVRYRAEVKLDSPQAQLMWRVYGTKDGLAGWHGLLFANGQLQSDTKLGDQSSTKVLKASFTEGVTYVVEQEITATGSVIYCYEKDKARTDGISTVFAGQWTQAADWLGHGTAGPNVAVGVATVSNFQLSEYTPHVSEQRYNTPDSDIDAWFVYINSGTINRVYDAERKQIVTQLQSTGTGLTGYQLTKDRGHNAWNSPGRVISWDMKYREPFNFFVSVQTNKGRRFIAYGSGNAAPTGSGNAEYVQYPMGNINDGQWHTVTRDLQADLSALQPDTEILSVDALLIHGSGRVGEVSVKTVSSETSLQQMQRLLRPSLADQQTRYIYDVAGRQRYQVDATGQITEYQYDMLGNRTETVQYTQGFVTQYNLSDSDIDAWFVYINSGTINRVYDAERKQIVTQLQSTGTGLTGYQLTKDRGHNAWNSPGRVISWDMKYREPFNFFVSVQTNKGRRFIAYGSGNAAPTGSGNAEYVQYPMGNINDGQWHTVTRDLQADLSALQPDTEILSVDALLIHGSGRVGEVSVKTVSSETSLQQMQRLLRPSTTNRRLRNLYDTANRLRFQIASDNTVTENRYDSFGNILQQIRYAKPVV